MTFASVLGGDYGRRTKRGALPDLTVATTLYDPRFATAKAVASRLGHGPLYAIHGDPTELAARIVALRRMPRADRTSRMLRMRGITTEAVPFCLAGVLPGARLSQRRLDRDLFIWTLEG
jgi:hypothetical protein